MKSKISPKRKILIKKKRQLFQTVKGMSDILPKEQAWWQIIRQVGFEVSELHDFNFIETPILEPAGMFEAGLGAGTDIVEKQMYTFKTKGHDQVVLRPEGTAPIMRSYFQHHLGYFSFPLKVFYYGPMFRYERPQAGRERQFHQWGFEVIGGHDPIYDVQMILIAFYFLKALKIKDLKLKINTIGCRICAPTYRQKLRDYYRYRKMRLCQNCQRRYDKNLLRLLDCKQKDCQELKEKAPIILDYLCQNCNNHFKAILELVEDNDILYEPDPYLVRGLDYYNRTVFEIFAPSSNTALFGGGRYDYLSELIGSRMVPSVGVALGLERIIEAMKAQDIDFHFKAKSKIFFITVGNQAKQSSLRLMQKLRQAGMIVAESIDKKTLRAQLRSADKMKVLLVLIFGQKEFFDNTIIIRDLRTGAQETVILDKMIEEVRKRLR